MLMLNGCEKPGRAGDLVQFQNMFMELKMVIVTTIVTAQTVPLPTERSVSVTELSLPSYSTFLSKATLLRGPSGDPRRAFLLSCAIVGL